MTQQEFFEKMAAVWNEYSRLTELAQAIETQMSELAQAGMSEATIHKRSDNGGMELLHPTGSTYERQTGRRREYIGKKPEAQQAAQERVMRYREYYKLEGQLSTHKQKLNDIKYQIDRLEMSTLGRQAKLFRENGDRPGTKKLQPCPIDYTRLTPAQVIDYFRQSPVLAGMADDVQAVLGKVEWAEVQKAA